LTPGRGSDLGDPDGLWPLRGRGMTIPARWGLWLGDLALVGWFVWAWRRLLPPRWIQRRLDGLYRRHQGPASAARIVAEAVRHYQLWSYTHLAYSDMFVLYGGKLLYDHALPYLDTPIQYPVLMGVAMWLAAWAPGVYGFFTVTAAGSLTAALLSFHWLYRRTPRLAWGFALSPLFLVYGLLNWDAIGIALMLGAVGLYGARRYDGAAFLLAVAVFFKFFPVFYLPVMLAELAAAGDWRHCGRLTAVFAATAVGINGGFILGNWANWRLFFTLNATRAVGADIWSNVLVHVTSVKLVDMASLVIVGAAVLLAVWQVRRGVPAVQAAAVVFAVFLFVNKVYSPQYTLWLLAFALMAEWPLWFLGVIAAAGLADYADSFELLRLYVVHAPTRLWYRDRVYPWGLVVRYGMVGLGVVVGTRRVRRARQPDRHPLGGLGEAPSSV
jgi:hypothetical protein